MFNFPYFGLPRIYKRSYYSPYPSYFSANLNSTYSNNLNNHISSSKSYVSTNNANNDDNSFDEDKSTDRFLNQKDPNNSYFFELFGLKLYFDDILIICLLYFLYNEGVKDEGLFIALILLLIT